jgi:hypothetical protein
MADLTPELAEEWRKEAEFHHDRYQRDGTGVGSILALTQARLLRALDELAALRDEVDRLTAPLLGQDPGAPEGERAPEADDQPGGPDAGPHTVRPRATHGSGRRGGGQA